MSALSVPEIDPDGGTLTAALAYAKAGWYVLPVSPAMKHAGSVLGKGWPAKSSRDPHEIAAWFAGSGDGLALHVGRSGAVALDVDDPHKVSALMGAAFLRDKPPHQSTREGAPGRGHYCYAMPPGRSIGNSVGQLGAGWGDVRGGNGIIVVSPSLHSKAADGGRYLWESIGALPVLPSDLASLLPDALHADDAATDSQVKAFLAAHTSTERPGQLRPILDRFTAKTSAGESRHGTAQGCLVWALKEAAAGLYPAQTAYDRLRPLFLASVTSDPGRSAKSEFAGMVAWAVSQASAADLDAVRRVADSNEDQRQAKRNNADPFGTVGSTPPVAVPVVAVALTMPPPLALVLDTGPLADPVPTVAQTDVERLDQQFPAVNWADLWAGEDTEPEWLCEPLLEVGQSIALVAPAKVGKSLLVLEIAAALAAGRSVLSNPARGSIHVLYIDLENAPKMVRERLESMGYGPADLAKLHYLSFPSLAALDSPLGGAQLLEIARRHDAQVVVIDTTSRVIEGEENSADTFKALYRHAIMPLKREGRAVLRIDHAGKDLERGARGSSAKNDDVDAVWLLAKRTETQLDLRRTHDRTGHGVDLVEMVRQTDPYLSHVVTGDGATIDAVVIEVAAELDRLGVALTAGRPTAGDALRMAGRKVGTGTLIKALAYRKRAPKTVRDSPDSHGTQDELTPVRAPVRTEPDPRSKNCPGQVADSPDSPSPINADDLSASLPPYRGDSGRTADPRLTSEAATPPPWAVPAAVVRVVPRDGFDPLPVTGEAA